MRVLAKGFRPFFLLGAVFAALVVPVWLEVYTGALAPAGPLGGVVWHAHEMIYGFTAAILAGFLLTAVGNWTGVETATGPALGLLAALWLAGRVALFFVPGWASSALDLAFLPALALTLARPLWRAQSRRNAAFPVLLLLLWGADLACHLDAHGVWPGVSTAANRLAVHVIAVMVLVVSGRVIPMFTRNATGAAGIGNIPLLDWTAVLATGAVAALQVSPALDRAASVAAAVASAAVAGRCWRWGARHTGRDPLLWVLHLGHGWLAVGLGLEAAAGRWPDLRPLALHALTVGAIGTMTLGMMARVALGHTGRPLRVRPVVGLAFGALVLAASLRVFGPLLAPAQKIGWLWASAALWSAAFGVYAISYAGILLRPRPDGRAG